MMMAMAVIVGFVIALASLGAGIAVRVLRRDEIFIGLIPGLLPAPDQQVARRHLRRGERVPIAVRFNPPDGVAPGLAGVAIDGRVDPVELSATLIDLGRRGWLRLRPLAKEPGAKPYDWELISAEQAPDEALNPTEEQLLRAAFSGGPATTLSAFRSSELVKDAPDVLLGEAQDRHWLLNPPEVVGWLTQVAGPALVLAGLAGMFVFHLGFIGLGALVGGGLFFALTRKLPESLTAEGSAVRAQCEGFKLYLATAEAEQLTFEASADIFSRYLPYAMVFGVVDHWRSVFAEAFQADAGAELDGLEWLVLDDALHTVMLFDLLGPDSGVFDALTTQFADFTDLPGVDGVIDSIGEAVSNFDIGDITDIFD